MNVSIASYSCSVRILGEMPADILPLVASLVSRLLGTRVFGGLEPAHENFVSSEDILRGFSFLMAVHVRHRR